MRTPRLAITRLSAAVAALLMVAARSGAFDFAAEIARGDELLRQGQLRDARAAYRAALDERPASYAALCRLAHVESELGEDAKGEERRQLVASAIDHARTAVQIAPDSAQGHEWLAVALGRKALKEGPKTRLSLSREIKSEVDRAIALDPTSGRAYHVRALWNRKIATLNAVERAVANAVLGGVPKGASMENAVRDLQKAVALEPEYVNHRLELGRTFQMVRNDADARRELEKAIALPPKSSPRDSIYQAEARELLRKLPRPG